MGNIFRQTNKFYSWLTSLQWSFSLVFFFSLGFQSVTVWEVSELVSIISKESIKAELSPNFSLTTKRIQAN